ncbi:hypothetical protein EVAR_34296_1 [Eumeta japonica]|uniref:Uncharacterized protein n=1 Tax=Eumeta variegata TaxID=151549 RepID=A0A4C1VXP6_EUMVA|nr:hypothetical protein EVAR_34296_1 [Eumeta japonica]
MPPFRQSCADFAVDSAYVGVDGRFDYGETVQGLGIQVLDALVSDLGHVRGVRNITKIYGFFEFPVEKGDSSFYRDSSHITRSLLSLLCREKAASRGSARSGGRLYNVYDVNGNAALNSTYYLSHAKLSSCRCPSARSLQNDTLYYGNIYGPHDLWTQTPCHFGRSG